MADVFDEYMTANQERRSPFIGPSGVGGCYRQHAYKYLGVEATDAPSTDAADLGTLFHLGYSAMIAARFSPEERRADVQVQPVGMPRPGEADDVDFVNKVVTDLKTVKARVMESWLNGAGPYDSYWDQLEVYALGLRQKFGGVWTMRILAFNRETGERAEWVRESDPEVGQALVDRAAFRHQQLTGAVSLTAAGALPLEVVEQFPREGKGPGRGVPCDWCPFVSACWPSPSSEDGSPQSETVRGDAEEVGRWAQEYLEAAAEARKADARKRDAQVFVKGLDGDYPLPDGGTVRVSTVGGKPKEVPDCDAMVAQLESAGLPVPMRWTRSSSYPKVTKLKK